MIWGIIAFAGFVLKGGLLNNVFLWLVLLVITCGPVYILQMLWANRLKQISTEVKKWNTLYKKKQMGRRLHEFHVKRADVIAGQGFVQHAEKLIFGNRAVAVK